MKKSVFVILLGVVMLLTGCKSADKKVKPPVYTSGEIYDGDYLEEYDMSADNIDCETDTAYKIEELTDLKMHTTKPFGVCIFNEQIIVCDREENKLVLLDMDRNFVKEIKTFSPDEEDILDPTGVTVFEDKLYLLDAGYSRILILDSDFTIQEIIELPQLRHHMGDVRYIDIVVDKDGIIYVTNESEDEYDAKVLVVENGECEKAGETLMGYLAEYNGEVYAMNYLELFVIKDGMIAYNGTSYLYRMHKTEMEKVKEMPYKISPMDFVFVKDKMIFTTNYWNSVYQFSCDNYEAEKELIHIDDEYRNDVYLAPLNETDFIITDGHNNRIYYLHY